MVRVPVGLRYCGRGGWSGRRECVYVTERAAHTPHTHTHTQRYTADATSSNENKSFHIADGRRGARGRARQHLHTSSLWHSYAKMRDLHSTNTNVADSAHTPRMYECVQKAVCFNLRRRRQCKYVLFLGTWIKHLVHRPLFSAPFFYCRNALLNCIFITLRADLMQMWKLVASKQQ
jgi:hypothetical protein